jgi:hypothetical protein
MAYIRRLMVTTYDRRAYASVLLELEARILFPSSLECAYLGRARAMNIEGPWYVCGKTQPRRRVKTAMESSSTALVSQTPYPGISAVAISSFHLP